MKKGEMMLIATPKDILNVLIQSQKTREISQKRVI